MGFLAIRFVDAEPDAVQAKALEGFTHNGRGTYSIGEPTAEDIRNALPEWPCWSTATLMEDWTYEATEDQRRINR